jgi:hypothetical protein
LRKVSELKYTDGNGEIKTTINDKEKAEVLTNFFTSVVTVEPDGALPDISNIQIDQPFEDYAFTTKSVQELLKELNPNKSMGPDGVYTLVLKELCETLAIPLTTIFNSSLKEGKLPEKYSGSIQKRR